MNDIVLRHLNWRYATKEFDTDKTISDADWDTLEEALVLTPSSYGLQPWKFFVIRNQNLKEQLVEASYGQKQVAQCSHLLVFAVKTSIDVDYIDRFLDDTCEKRSANRESLDFYRNMMIGDVVEGPRSQDISGWAKLQAYIALGNFMTCAALLKIDCCPMEGFLPKQYDELLGLNDHGLTTAVVCPAGYRSDSDKYASAAKIRFPREELVTHIE